MTKSKLKYMTYNEQELKNNVPFIKGKSVKHYCDNCIKRDGEEFKDQTCSYRTPATANKSQYYRNHIAMNECPSCHNDLGISLWNGWEKEQ